MRTKIKEVLSHPSVESIIGHKISVCGWARTVRDQKSFAFVELNDGSTLANLQIIIDSQQSNYSKLMQEITTGAALSIDGIVVASPGKNQKVELKAESIHVYGLCDAATYPLQKKRHSFEFLRTIAHLRPRTNTQGSVLRVRNAMAMATHQFFQGRGFLYVQTPIITGSDCEGAGAMFRVTTLDMQKGHKDFSEDFFAKPTYLTVSGQLEGEAMACALSDIYTFGPTFRAEKSNTYRHLAEFWQIEPEMAFADLRSNMECAESYIRYCTKYALEQCKEDLEFFDQFIEKGLIQRLEGVANTSFAHLTYTKAIFIVTHVKRFNLRRVIS